MNSLFAPCIKSIGPADAKVVVIGEAPGADEERTGIPFVGSAGQEMDSLLTQAGFRRRDLLLTNVLFTRPFANKMENVTIKSKELRELKKAGLKYDLKAVSQGRYLHPSLAPELDRLHSELAASPRNLIIALGNTALWSITGSFGISKLRGTIASCPFGKFIATYHPSAVLRDWSLRPITLVDLMKAFRESTFPEVRRPVRYVTINPTLEEVLAFCQDILDNPPRHLSIDVETRGGHITCLGIATSPSEALVCPFFSWDRRANTSVANASAVSLPRRGSFWTPKDETTVRLAINRVLKSPIPKLFQNGLYDIQYLLREGYQLWNCLQDTMLQQHALYPELPKSLGFLGSVHTSEPAWKLMRPRGDEQLKRDDE